MRGERTTIMASKSLHKVFAPSIEAWYHYYSTGRTHPHAGASRDYLDLSLDLSQHPDVVDELEGHVHELLVDSAHLHLAPVDQEHIVGCQLLLNLV